MAESKTKKKSAPLEEAVELIAEEPALPEETVEEIPVEETVGCIVRSPYFDRITDEYHGVGEHVEVTVSRYEEIMSKGDFLECR